ncbi:MAG: phosphohistidine swiveling domain-containing protein [Planctomycetota bacterium]|jgi:phosphohistidine swiveling domain-containing protein
MAQTNHLSSQPWSLGSKANTLAALAGQLKTARVLPQVPFTVGEWRQDGTSVLAQIASKTWSNGPLIVRSSAMAEDRPGGKSLAGKFMSVSDVRGSEALVDAIRDVTSSYKSDFDFDQVFVQPMLEDVQACGVAFTRDPSTGAPYFVINVDESGATDGVTSGSSSDLRTIYLASHADQDSADPISFERYRPVRELLRELQTLTQTDAIDVEFALDRKGELVLLQVRPLSCPEPSITDEEHRECLQQVTAKIRRASLPHPYIHGQRAVFGVMPDWNPAEIIGARPRPLALSLYQDLITNSIWAYQRDKYGYRNLRSFPLLLSFHGLPYIDVRLSFNSFLPKDLPAPLAARLADYYLERLLAQPTLHDKVEFEIALSCYSLDLPERLKELATAGISSQACGELASSLRRLTNRVINGETGLWREERCRIQELEHRREVILTSGIDPASRIWWLLEDCKRYGTLPFAGLARCGFIAVQMLRSLVSTGIMTTEDHDAFYASLSTVSSQMNRDLASMSRNDFLATYGHLRPGTYDILSHRYDETPDSYFEWPEERQVIAERPAFELTPKQRNHLNEALKRHGIEHDARSLMNFIRTGIEGREYAKFVFTRSLSDAMTLLCSMGKSLGFSREDCSFFDIADLRRLIEGSCDSTEVMRESIERGRKRFATTSAIALPPIIRSAEDVWSFEQPPGEPNYITQKMASGVVVTIDSKQIPAGSILFMPSADPGYDWIFSRNIAGFVTAFGGANSHMAIRANELGIPAVIGAGELLYSQWKGAGNLRIDCANRKVEILKSA